MTKVQGSIAQKLSEFVPTPNEELTKKYNYFYRAYGFDLNSSRYMTFDEQSNPVLTDKLTNLQEEEDFLRSRE